MKIEFTGVTRQYGKVTALQGIDLVLESPGMVGLVGPNGAGKSSLMKILVGQLPTTAGTVCIDGNDLTRQGPGFKRRLGYLPQEFGLYEELTVQQFLDYMLCLKGKSTDRKRAIESVLRDTRLEEKADETIATLSGGQKQRVGIAQALLGGPELLIVDEPTVGLDPEERIHFRNLLSDNAGKRLVILSTHIIDDVESVCNRLIVLNRGMILFHGAPSELICAAQGHVAVIEMAIGADQSIAEKYRITSRVMTTSGLRCRVVGDDMPQDWKVVEPTLEDAYVYRTMKGVHERN